MTVRRIAFPLGFLALTTHGNYYSSDTPRVVTESFDPNLRQVHRCGVRNRSQKMSLRTKYKLWHNKYHDLDLPVQPFSLMI
jgi:hypothetical protein